MAKFHATIRATIQVVIEVDASTLKDARALLSEHGHDKSVRQFRAIDERITGAQLLKLEKA